MLHSRKMMLSSAKQVRLINKACKPQETAKGTWGVDKQLLESRCSLIQMDVQGLRARSTLREGVARNPGLIVFPLGEGVNASAAPDLIDPLGSDLVFENSSP